MPSAVAVFLWAVALLQLSAAAASARDSGAAGSFSFSVVPEVLEAADDPILMSWSGWSNPQVNDTVEVWAIAPGAPLSNVQLGWFNLSYFSTYTEGFGSANFTLFNVRYYSFQFSFVPAGGQPVASAKVSYADPNEPTHIRLAYTGSATEMRVMWTTGDELAGNAQVQYYGAHEPEVLFATATASTYAAADMCGEPATDPANFIDPGYIQDAVMTDLVPGETYYYRVGDTSSSLPSSWSGWIEFSAPSVPGADVPSLLYNFGDMGTVLPFETNEEQQPPSALVAGLMAADIASRQGTGVAQAVAHFGDISYARGYAKYWEAFETQVGPISARVPYMVSFGNHEYDWPGQPFKPSWANYGTDSGGECGLATVARYHMPGGEVGPDVAYSFDHGSMHVVMLSSEHDFLPGSEQYAFLVSDLEAVDRSVTPWVIVTTHRPFYSSSEGFSLNANYMTGSFDDHMRAALEPVFLTYEVDVVLVGHVHLYERSCGVTYNFTCAPTDEQGTVHVSVGTGGNVYQPYYTTSLPQTPSMDTYAPGAVPWRHDPPDWSVFRTMSYGYGRLFTNATTLHYQFVGFRRGELHDEFFLNRS